MKPPVSDLTFDDLILAPSWIGASSVILSVARISRSLAPTRRIGEITISFSETEGIPVKISGSIPEDWNDGRKIVSLCKALLAYIEQPLDTPYDANFYFGSPKTGVSAQQDKGGNAVNI